MVDHDAGMTPVKKRGKEGRLDKKSLWCHSKKFWQGKKKSLTLKS